MTTSTHRDIVETTAATEQVMRPQQVPVNVYEAPEALVIVAPLPAVQADDINIEVDAGQVRFWAHLRSAGPREYLLHEWDYGGYERVLDLPDGFGSGVEATYSHGQLVIRILRGVCDGRLSVTPVAH